MGLLLGAGILVGCEQGPDLSPQDRAACERWVTALPSTLADQPQQDRGRDGATAASYGDPAITVSCGVGRPAEYDEFSTCQEVDGVGWFVPPEEIGSDPVDVTLTAVGYRPRVAVHVPADYWPSGSAAVTAELADAVSSTLDLDQPCR